MIRAGVGLSTKGTGVEAAGEASSLAMEQAGITKADWALVFTTFPHRAYYQEILSSVCNRTQTKKVCGCSAIGVLSGSNEVEAEPAVVVLAVSSSGMRVKPFIAQELGAGGINAGEEIGDKFKNGCGKNSMIAILPDPFHINPELLFKGVESRLGRIPIVGAAASEDPRISDTFEFFGDTVASSAVSGLFFDGDFSCEIDITQGCQPVGPPCLVTKADKNLIYELDGEPAYSVLSSRVSKSILEDPGSIMRLLFVAFPPSPDDNEIKGGSYLVRNIIGFDPETGVIGVAQHVKEGQTVAITLRNPDMARQDLKEMLERIKSREDPAKPYKFGLYFNCCARGSSLYGHEGIDTAYISNVFGNVPIAGFFGNSEFAPLDGANYLFTYTGVLVLFSEG